VNKKHTRDLVFLVIGIVIIWKFFKPTEAKAEEIPKEALAKEIPEPEVYTVPPITTSPFPQPGFYFAELIPFSQEQAVVAVEEEEKEEEPVSMYDMMESIVKQAGIKL